MEIASKSNRGRFFEDYSLGQKILHAAPRTLTNGERALYHALYPSRHALASSDAFARNCGFPSAPLDDWLVFHTVFGKTVPDISLNAVANLGYANARFLKPVYPGTTLSAQSEVIGLKENSNGKTGIIWVHSAGFDDGGDKVLEFVRWVMVRKSDSNSETVSPTVPQLNASVAAADLVVPDGLSFADYDFESAGEPHRWGDYAVGEKIDHIDGTTIEDAEHMLATRLWQNTAKVHFDINSRPDQTRLIYGGHVISIARALSFNGLANAQLIAGINAGSHVAPCTAGMTVRAWSEVLEKATTANESVGAIRLRLVATTTEAFDFRQSDGAYSPGVLLDLDYWALMPV